MVQEYQHMACGKDIKEKKKPSTYDQDEVSYYFQ